MRFYEINPAAEAFARRYFTFLADSRAAVSVVIGDARLSIERSLRDGSGSRAFDVLAIDAFSGDAIPVHLLTREAFALYAATLEADGVLAVHVSNRYLDLKPVVRGLARELGRQALEVETDEDQSLGVEGSTWVLVTANEAFAAGVKSLAEPARADARSLVWTDAFSSLLPVLKR
jgi:spermidine synthase